jgi:hypothetical protein
VVWPQNHWDGFLRFGLKTDDDGFSRFDLKTDRYNLVIWASKSSRRFLGLCLKIKQATIYRFCHKTNWRTTVWDLRRDLVAYFAWKQVVLGFLNPASRLAEARWRVVHVTPSRRLRRGQVEDGRINATGYVGPCYPCFIVFFILGHMGIVVF